MLDLFAAAQAADEEVEACKGEGYERDYSYGDVGFGAGEDGSTVGWWEVGEAGEVSWVGTGGRGGVEAGENAVLVNISFCPMDMVYEELTCLLYVALHLRLKSLPEGL